MLVLSRKANQSVHIGDNITINVVRIKGNTIQLGIEAPKDIPIVRAELTAKDAASRASSVPSNNKTQSTALSNSLDQDRPRPNGSVKAGSLDSAAVEQGTAIPSPALDRPITMRLEQDSLSERCLSLVF